MKKRGLASISILLLFWSCSDSALYLGSVDEEAQVSVESIGPGALVPVGEGIPLRIVRDPVYTGDTDSPDSLIVELLDLDGTVLADQRYDSVSDATVLPPIELPGIADGLYRLRTAYYDGEDLISENAVPFFLVSETYEILGLTSYPASSYPEADALLRLSLDVPSDSDPFLVWRVNDRVVESGYLSQTGSTVAVVAPSAEGVFPVRVDLYPVWPDGADVSEISAPATYSTELYVSGSPAPARTDLLPEESFFALYHFRGLMRDAGVRTRWFTDRNRDFSAVPFGGPALSAHEGLFGYMLDGTSGFEIRGAVWPVFADELSPVSFMFRVLPLELSGVRQLMRIELPAEDLATVLVAEDGQVGLRLGMLNETIWSGIPVLMAGEPETIAVSVVPHPEAATVQFFAGGHLVSSYEIAGIALTEMGAVRLLPATDEWAAVDGGTTVIGAETDGFAGVIDEVGVFFRDRENAPSTNTELFAQSMRSQYGERLVYAASFEDDAEAESLEVSGEVAVEDGALRISEGASVSFPPFAFEEEDLIVTMELEGAGNAVLRLFGIESEALLAEHSVGIDPEERRQEVTLVHSAGVLTLVSEDGEEVIADELGEFSGVRLDLVGESGDESPVSVLSIVARRERQAIPEGLFRVSGD